MCDWLDFRLQGNAQAGRLSGALAPHIDVTPRRLPEHPTNGMKHHYYDDRGKGGPHRP
jgi:hypothetical protein